MIQPKAINGLVIEARIYSSPSISCFDSFAITATNDNDVCGKWKERGFKFRHLQTIIVFGSKKN